MKEYQLILAPDIPDCFVLFKIIDNNKSKLYIYDLSDNSLAKLNGKRIKKDMINLRDTPIFNRVKRLYNWFYKSKVSKSIIISKK